MRNALVGAILVLALLAAAAAWVWRYQPERLPAEWRRQNPHSREYSPPVYRWHDEAGQMHLTDTPPSGRPYETLYIDPRRNVVPTTLPPPGATR